MVLMPAQVAVELTGVSKRFGTLDALHQVDLRVPTGQVVALLGPNGAGKTTAISLMLGMRRPTTGQVRLFGLEPRDRRARSRCGVMLQESAVPGTLHVRELIDLFRSYYPAPLGLDHVLEAAGLSDQANTQASRLSGGQKQRLYFALAICGDPELLFLDEPTAGMDVEARRGLWAFMRNVAHAGRTILLTTHYLEEADALADRVVVINCGELIADASPSSIKAHVPGRRVRFEADPVLCHQLLRTLPVERVSVSERDVQFLTAHPERVLSALFNAGLDLHNLEVGGAQLEEAFLDLTQPNGHTRA